jgi:proteasome accessory factor C
MSDTAAAQLRRVLDLLPRLADGEEHSLDSIAKQSDTDTASVSRDLWSLVTRYDDPGGFVEGIQLYLEPDSVCLVSNHFRRPMRLTTSELCALELGLAMLRSERPPDERAALEGARKRLRELIARLPGDAISDSAFAAELGAAGDPAHLSAARSAFREHRKLRLRYRRGDGVESDERLVCPYALVSSSGMLYIVGFCDSRAAIRIFRLDRVEEALLTDEKFEMPDSFSLDHYLSEGRAFRAEQSDTLVVRYSPRVARWIAEREGKSLGEDGSLTIEHPLADAAWAVRHVLQYGPDAEVIEPPVVRALVLQRLREMAGMVGRS